MTNPFRIAITAIPLAAAAAAGVALIDTAASGTDSVTTIRDATPYIGWVALVCLIAGAAYALVGVIERRLAPATTCVACRMLGKPDTPGTVRSWPQLGHRAELCDNHSSAELATAAQLVKDRLAARSGRSH